MKGRKWGLLLVILWPFVVYFAYYVVHKPLGPAHVQALARTAWGIVVWALLLVTANGVGGWALRQGSLHRPGEEWSLRLGLGLGLMGLLALGMGLAGLLHRPLLWIAALSLAVMGCRKPGLPLSRLRQLKPPTIPLPSGFDGLLALFALLVLLLALPRTLTPPTAWDSQVYHLTGPALYLRRHRIVGDVDLPYLGFPQLGEMLFLWGMALGGDTVARLIHFSFLLLTILLLYSFACHRLGEGSGWPVVVVLLSASSVVLLSTWAYVDMALLFYETAAFVALVRWREEGGRRWLALAAIYCGLAMGVKYTALTLLPALGLLVVLKEGEWRTRLGALGLFGGLAALVASPWYAKNALLYGNPVYPFFFGGPFWDEFRSWWYSRWGTGLMREPWRLVIAPWEMTIWGVEGKEGYAATIGPLFLAFLPLVVLIWDRLEPRERRLLRWGALAFGVQYALWLAGVAGSALLVQTRLLLPAFGLLAMLTGHALARADLLNRPSLSVGWLVRAMVVFVLALELLSGFLGFVKEAPLPHLMGEESREEYLRRRLGAYHQVIEHINRELPSEAKVLFLWEPRSYYCQRTCLPDAILDRFKHLIYLQGDAPSIAAYLREEGVTHVLLYQVGLEHILAAGFDPITPDDLAVLKELLERFLYPVYDDGVYVVYEWRKP